jgi:stearoyl-CoA desaturase (delta-9 desaturase)
VTDLTTREPIVVPRPESQAQDHKPHDELERLVSADVRIWNLFGVSVPFLGLAAAIVLLWGHGCDWLSLTLMLVMYTITGTGVTIGFHRLFTHRAFKTSRFVQVVLIIMGSMSVEGTLLTWVAQHRRHHQSPDQEGDPHSPHLHGEGLRGILSGFWHAHIGWFLAAPDPELYRYVSDLWGDPVIRRAGGLFKLWVVLGLALPAAIAGWITHSWHGALLGLIWGGFVRIFLIHHVTWSINSVCHLWGGRTYHTHDESRNNFVFAVLAFGEGWHNNHHAFPTSARHGLKWWQIDMSYIAIRTLEMLGLAWDVKRPSEMAMAMKREGNADAAAASEN